MSRIEIDLSLYSDRTPGITRRAFNLITDRLTIKAVLFAVGCMPLLDGLLPLKMV